MTLRIRQVKPAFWSDAKLLHLSPEVRLFYIGLWSAADDAGWFENDPEQIAIDLHLPEALVNTGLECFVRAGRIVLYECGHGVVLHFSEHQRLAGPTRRVETTYHDHCVECPPNPATFHTLPPLSTLKTSRQPLVPLSPPLSTHPRENGEVEGEGEDKVEDSVKVTGEGEDKELLAPKDEMPAVLWLTAHRTGFDPNGSKLHQLLIRVCQQHTTATVIRTFEELKADNPGVNTANQYVLGADDRLNPLIHTTGPPKAKGFQGNLDETERATERA